MLPRMGGMLEGKLETLAESLHSTGFRRRRLVDPEVAPMNIVEVDTSEC